MRGFDWKAAAMWLAAVAIATFVLAWANGEDVARMERERHRTAMCPCAEAT